MKARTLLCGGLAAVSMGLSMASCRGAPTRLFVPESVAPTVSPRPYDGPPIRVDAVHVPPSLDRVQMLGDIAPGELQVDDHDHWAAPLGLLARQTLTADLAARLPAGRVLFPSLAKPPGAQSLAVDILAFTADKHGARLEASWGLSSTLHGRDSSAPAVVLQYDHPSATPAAMAGALSDLLAQLADRIAAYLASGNP
jgi:hypothetical protein